MNTTLAHKTVFAVQYRPALRFYDRLYSAAEGLDGYPDWQTTRLQITLRDIEHRCSVGINHTQISYDQDSSDSEQEAGRIAQVLKTLPDKLEVDSFTRLGCRKWFLRPVSMSYPSLVNVLSVKLFSQTEALRAILPTKIDDLLYRLDCSDPPYRFHLTLGPVKRHEVPRYLPFNADMHLRPDTKVAEVSDIVESYPDVAIIIDLDMYEENESITVQRAEEFHTIACERINAFASAMSEYLFSTK